MLRSIDWNGLQAMEFSKGDYTALLVPSVGANLVRLAHTGLGVEILRTPNANETDTFRRRPHVFGLPILFPPNRIADGSYSFDGRTYRFPITIEREHNYHHGLLKSQPFAVSKAQETDDEVLVECRYYSNAGNDAIFRDFPHEFRCKIVYRLTANGLEQEVVFTNRSRNPMPVGVGFHTPLRIPFAGGTDADYVMRVAVGEQVELDGRNLPTGRKLPLTEEFARLRTGGLRVTDDATMEIVQQVLAGKVNKDLVAKLRGRGVGLCGMDGQMLRCTELDPQLGHVGEIVHVDPTLISSLLDSGYIPVIATVGMDDLGQAYNVNADTAAAQIAIALKAEKLVSMTDIAGLLRDKEDESTLIPEVEVSEIEGYKSAGIIAGGMIPKIGGMADAIYQGVHEAVIIDGRVPHSILLELFSDRGSGTRFYRRSHHE